jgi:hypothetical protein
MNLPNLKCHITLKSTKTFAKDLWKEKQIPPLERRGDSLQSAYLGLSGRYVFV